MSSELPISRPMRVLLLSLILLFCPMSWSLGPDGEWVFGVDAARADNDDHDDNDDDDNDDDDDDDDDDDKGDDKGDDDDDDKGDDVGADVDYDKNDDGSNSARDLRVPENLHLRYPNGWNERILNGRYILIDPKGRTVSNRRATMDDLDRMRDAADL